MCISRVSLCDLSKSVFRSELSAALLSLSYGLTCAGNQPKFESKLVEGPDGQRVRAVLVPDFSVDPTCVLVNLRTLECESISFAGLEPMCE